MNQRMNESLFGHLAYFFSKSPENLATEALCFILNRSQAAKESFVLFLKQTGAELPTNLKFETQEGGPDNAIPDLVGINADGKTLLIGEAKFWAGLTNNQPVTYLKRLVNSAGSVLLFIAPSRRFPTLWPALIQRCHEASIHTEDRIGTTEALKIASVGKNAFLALSSWRAILDAICQAAERDHDLQTASDIMQLQGLCDRMDENAFSPIRSEELTSEIGLRITQYRELIDDVTKTLVTKKRITVEGLRSTSSGAMYERHMNIHQYRCVLEFDPEWWATRRETPIWFTVWKMNDFGKWAFPSKAKEKLRKLAMENPSRLFEEANYLAIPLYLPISVERDAVLSSLLDQLQEIIRYLEIQ